MPLDEHTALDTGTHVVRWAATDGGRLTPPLAASASPPQPPKAPPRQKGAHARIFLSLTWIGWALWSGEPLPIALTPVLLAVVALWFEIYRPTARVFATLLTLDVLLLTVIIWYLGSLQTAAVALYFPSLAGHEHDPLRRHYFHSAWLILFALLALVGLESAAILPPREGGIPPGFDGLLRGVEHFFPWIVGILGLHFITQFTHQQAANQLGMLQIAYAEQVALRKAQVTLTRQLADVERMEALERLSGSIAHDFNNYLAGIRGLAELNLDALPEADPLRSDLEGIRETADSAAQLARELLAFSKHSGGERVPIDLRQIVDELRGLAGSLLGPTVSLAVLTPPTPATILANPNDIKRIFLNLVTNARDAMPSGGQLTIRVAVDEDESRSVPGELRVAAEIQDSGEGMSAEILSHLFEPYFSTKGGKRGAGLGLATVYGLVMKHQGDIRVSSKEGVGSTFSVRFPFFRATVLGAAGAQQLPPRRRVHILLVEDDPLVLHTTSRLLSREGHMVYAHASAEDAIAWAAQTPLNPDVLLTDIIMGGMNGVDLARVMHEAFPQIKTVFMSGFSGPALEAQVGPLRDAPLVVKPFSGSELLATIQKEIS